MNERRDASDEELGAAYAEVVAARPAPGPHPSPEALQDIIDRRLPESERLALLDHVAACNDCSRELELLRSVAHAGARDRATARWRRPTVWAIAAGFVVMATGGIVAKRLLDRNDGAEIVRTGQSAVTLLSPVRGETTASPVVLRWNSVPDVLGYSAEIVASDDRTVATATTADTMFALPDSVRLTPGASYGWFVRARLRDGTELRSELGEFRAK